MVVMWEPTEAVVVSWQVRCRFWDDFFSSLDEVGILPISETWLLLYHDEDQLVRGKPRSPLLDQDARESAWKPPAKPLVHRDDVLRLLRAKEKISALKLSHQETGVGDTRAINAVNAR